MIDAIIVFGSIACAVAFALGWLASPALRARIERPKHRFQASVRQYDRRDELWPNGACEDD